jgi:transposase
MDVVKELDLSAIYRHYERELRGYPPYHPEMMVTLLVYCYCTGAVSSRKIERRTHEDVACRVIAAGQHPDHTRIAEFRRVHIKTLSELFVQVLVLCKEAGLVKLGHVALDGTKMKANASKHKAMSYDRMTAEISRLRTKVGDLLKHATEADAAEDREFGKDKRGDELPEELLRSESRLARIREVKAALEAEAKSQQTATSPDGKKDDDRKDPPDLPSHRIPTSGNGKPTGKAQRNFTDPESRIMKTSNGFIQGYNCQAAVDEARQIIVAQAVTNQCPDPEHFVPMMEQVKRNCGADARRVTVDNGFWSEAGLEHMKGRSDVYMAAGRLKHGEERPTYQGRPPRNLTVKQRMARKLATKRGAKYYSRRKATVEPAFGEIKEVRGFRQFLLRGLEQVRCEWALMTMTHNLLKLFKFGPWAASRLKGAAALPRKVKSALTPRLAAAARNAHSCYREALTRLPDFPVFLTGASRISATAS